MSANIAPSKITNPRRSNELANDYSQFSPLLPQDLERLNGLARRELRNRKSVQLVVFGQSFDDLTPQKLATLASFDKSGVTQREEGQDALINDEVLNGKLHLICHDLDTFGYENRASTIFSYLHKNIVLGKGLAANVVRKKKLDGEDFSKVTMHFWPLNINNVHWVCIFIFPSVRKIFYFDPLGGENREATGKVTEFLKVHHQGPTYTVYYLRDDIQSETETGVLNTSACGILVLAYASSFAYGFLTPENLLNKNLGIRRDQMPYTVKKLGPDRLANKRLRICNELVLQKITSRTFGVQNRGQLDLYSRVLHVEPNSLNKVVQQYIDLRDSSDESDAAPKKKPKSQQQKESRTSAIQADTNSTSDLVKSKNFIWINAIDHSGFPTDPTTTFEELIVRTSTPNLVTYIKNHSQRFPSFTELISRILKSPGNTTKDKVFRIQLCAWLELTAGLTTDSITDSAKGLLNQFQDKVQEKIQKL